MPCIVINDGTNTLLLDQVILATSKLSRIRGLLGHAELPQGTGMMICPCKNIHTYFMRFAIDVAFLDENLHVLEIAQNIPPWRFVPAPPNTTRVIETIANGLNLLKPGDQLREIYK